MIVKEIKFVNCMDFNEQEIRLYAYNLWEQLGKPDGIDVHIWLVAEQHLIMCSELASIIKQLEDANNQWVEAYSANLGVEE